MSEPSPCPVCGKSRGSGSHKKCAATYVTDTTSEARIARLVDLHAKFVGSGLTTEKRFLTDLNQKAIRADEVDAAREIWSA